MWSAPIKFPSTTRRPPSTYSHIIPTIALISRKRNSICSCAFLSCPSWPERRTRVVFHHFPRNSTMRWIFFVSVLLPWLAKHELGYAFLCKLWPRGWRPNCTVDVPAFSQCVIQSKRHSSSVKCSTLECESPIRDASTSPRAVSEQHKVHIYERPPSIHPLPHNFFDWFVG